MKNRKIILNHPYGLERFSVTINGLAKTQGLRLFCRENIPTGPALQPPAVFAREKYMHCTAF